MGDVARKRCCPALELWKGAWSSCRRCLALFWLWMVRQRFCPSAMEITVPLPRAVQWVTPGVLCPWDLFERRILALPATTRPWCLQCFRANLRQRSPSKLVLVFLSHKFCLRIAVSLCSFKPEVIAGVQTSPLSPCIFLVLFLSFFVITFH